MGGTPKRLSVRTKGRLGGPNCVGWGPVLSVRAPTDKNILDPRTLNLGLLFVAVPTSLSGSKTQRFWPLVPYHTLTPAMAGAGQRSVFSGRRRPAPPAPRDAHRGRTQADARTLFTPTDYTLGHPSPPPRAARACSWCASPVGKSQKMRPQRTMTNGEAPATYKLLRGGTG